MPRLRFIILLVAIAVAANIALSWSIALWSNCDLYLVDQSKPVPRWISTRMHDSRDFFVTRGQGWSIESAHMWSISRQTEHGLAEGGTTMFRVGWPCKSMSWQLHRWKLIPSNKNVQDRAGPWSGGIPLGKFGAAIQARDNRVLPLRPEWPGFLANTTIFSSALALVFIMPRELRRYARLRRGQCPSCGYPLGDFTACPECGQAAPAKSVA